MKKILFLFILLLTMQPFFAQDTDSDGIANVLDLDDDNDGILDTAECPVLFVGEYKGTFGTSPSAAAFYRDLQIAPGGDYVYGPGTNGNAAAGNYTVANQAGAILNHAANIWEFPGHTTGLPNDNYLLVNGSQTVGTFFKEDVVLTGGGSYVYGLWHKGAYAQGVAGAYDLKIEIRRVSDNLLVGSFNTGPIPDVLWRQATISFTAPTTGAYRFSLNNTSVQFDGNDFSIDDITLNNLNCMQDTDGDGIPDRLDLDSDNDGCPDATEGANNYATTATLTGGSNGGSSGNLGTTVNANGIPIPPGTVGGSTGQATTSGVTSPTQINAGTTPPATQTANTGNTVTLTSNATGDIATTWATTTPFAPNYTTPGNATAALTYSWTKDGTTIVGATSATLTLTGVTTADSGTYVVTIRHANNYCGSSSSTVLTVLPLEICNNGIDDDGDGLIDDFDSDCPCGAGNYGNYVSACTPACSYTFVSKPFSMVQKWQSASTALSYNTPLVADVDNDGVSEVIFITARNTPGGSRVAQDIAIANGEDGTTQAIITTPYLNWSGATPIVVGDVTGATLGSAPDGKAEIIVATSTTSNTAADRRRLICYSNTGVELWRTATYILPESRYSHSSPGLADFNHDGIAEVYIDNQIYNARTGVLLVEGGAANSTGSGISSVVADFLPSNNSLELAAGNTVYSVNITNTAGSAGNTMTATVLPGKPDGYTAAADIDLDGLLDIVVTHYGSGIYVWNPRTVSLIASRVSGAGGGGQPFIGDVDNDGDPDIGYCATNRLYMFSYNGTTTLAQKWVLTTTDGSGSTGLSMFDFNQDGAMEIVYRDETRLRIINGDTGANLTTIASTSGTGWEFPVVADIDNDGQAEIVIGTSAGFSVSTGRMRTYKTNGQAWAPARNMWNQSGYHNTNINDNLTIPLYEQNHGLIFVQTPSACSGASQRPLNNFLAQSSPRDRNGCLAYPTSDATISIVSTACSANNKVAVTFTVSNVGDAVLAAGTPVRFYLGNPLTTAATIFPELAATTAALSTGQSETFTVLLDFSLTSPPYDVYVAVNDNGNDPTPFSYPTTAGAECSYANNLNSQAVTCGCYNLPNTATAGIETKHGVTLLQRAGADNGNWPMIRNSAHTVLESNIKGFVITRMTTLEIEGQTTPSVILPKISNPQEGMMVYDTDAKCLKLYDGTAWSCFNTPTCP